ncbi:Peptidylprolyl isomerase domain and WD repeat-containing protein 1 [Acipenser ruthenus]|uniref:peptidylprolyl isomerase n=1 Tax=Acipenser ruthenus TaxID=7906 RepID=A0A662YKB7_ACIRT|nr:Peptidylprolyl isomerase domain and WD repeat-containing protein 1 [Acipenser ruthenus]
MASSTLEQKRKLEVLDENGGEAAEDELVGPLPAEATQSKKRKGKLLLEEKKKNTRIVLMTSLLEFERVYLDNLPSAAMYERSYMHRDVITHIACTKCVRILGKQENIRVVQLGLFQGIAKVHHAAPTIEMKASDNPALQRAEPDPTIFCTAFKKNRFYMFTKREPEDTKSAESDRDIFNEKPSKEEVMAATQAEGPKRVSDSAIIHTTMGDVHIKLFPVECPKTVENFCVHSRNGYYNGHIFHRVIKGFMIQTGDPTGTGMGGESIWGGEFEDEFHATLRHDRPYTLSMANGGPGTNGSQFFITVVPTPWLDNKHTVFGRITKGMEVVQRISNVKINPKTDKPYEDISIINITVK